MKRRAVLAGLCGLACGALWTLRRPRKSGSTFFAFSLLEAEQRLRADPTARRAREISMLAGITRLTGMVFDRDRRDLIIVGEVYAAGDTVALEDLATAIRALAVHKQYPLVSIDKTPETKTTRKQRVRFEGGIQKTAFGAQLLAADVLLKKMVLGLPPVENLPFPSYFRMCSDYAQQKGQAGRSSSRLWFHAQEASLLAREDVFAIRALRVGVTTEVVGDGEARDEISDRFAGLLTENYEDLSGRFPEIRHLRNLFDLVALAKGVESMPGVDVSYWTKGYQLRPVDTPEEYELVARREGIETGGQARLLEVDGGIDTKVLRMRLQDGDLTAFKEAVLLSRPRTNSLTWPVPLLGWGVGDWLKPDAASYEDPEEPLGSYLERNIVDISRGGKPAAIPSSGVDTRGGVTAGVQVAPQDFGRKP